MDANATLRSPHILSATSPPNVHCHPTNVKVVREEVVVVLVARKPAVEKAELAVDVDVDVGIIEEVVVVLVARKLAEEMVELAVDVGVIVAVVVIVVVVIPIAQTCPLDRPLDRSLVRPLKLVVEVAILTHPPSFSTTPSLALLEATMTSILRLPPSGSPCTTSPTPLAPRT